MISMQKVVQNKQTNKKPPTQKRDIKLSEGVPGSHSGENAAVLEFGKL